jgi:hypothetical protein
VKRFILLAVEVENEGELIMSPFQLAHLGVQRIQHHLGGVAVEDVTLGIEALATARIGVD